MLILILIITMSLPIRLGIDLNIRGYEVITWGCEVSTLGLERQLSD